MIQQHDLMQFAQQLADFDDRLGSLRDSNGQLDRDSALVELEICREELRVAEEELRAQHEELAAVAQGAPRMGMNQHLLDELPVATLASDRLGVLTGANRLAAHLLGGPAHVVVGRPLATYLIGDRKPFRKLLGRLEGGDDLDRVHVQLRAATVDGHPRNSVGAVLIARRDGDHVKWVVVPDEHLRSDGGSSDRHAQHDRENSHLAIEAMSMLPITTATMPELLTEMERLATQSLPSAASVHLVLDPGPSADRADGARPEGHPFPLQAHGNGMGVMYVADGTAGPLSAAERRSAQLVADAAAAMVSNLLALQESRALVAHLSHALENRPVIEQAKGMLMAVRNCDEDTAFDHLRAISQQTNTKLHDVARGLVHAMSPNGRSTAAPPGS
ncbi:MAG: ANTAR domain-containing protein [Mycobacteriales bacterium]